MVASSTYHFETKNIVPADLLGEKNIVSVEK